MSALPQRCLVPEPDLAGEAAYRAALTPELAALCLSRRFLRQPRSCVICAAQRQQLQQDDGLAGNARHASVVLGWAWQCADCPPPCSYQLCHSCYQRGAAYHAHPPSHRLLRVEPPAPPPLRSPPDGSAEVEHHYQWYTAVRGQAWRWQSVLVQPESYERVVLAADSDVLLGWWNWTEPRGLHALVAALLPFLHRLLQELRAEGSAASTAQSLVCALFVDHELQPTNASVLLDGVDCDWLEATVAMGSLTPRTAGAQLARDGGCAMYPARRDKAFAPPDQRDVFYRDWPLPLSADAPLAAAPTDWDVDSAFKLFSDWVSWAHRTMRGSPFDLPAVLHRARAYAEQMSLLLNACTRHLWQSRVEALLQRMQTQLSERPSRASGSQPISSWRPESRDPQWGGAVQEALARLERLTGPQTALEDLPVKQVRAALLRVEPVTRLWRSRLAVLQSLEQSLQQPEETQSWEASTGAGGSLEPMAASGHTRILSCSPAVALRRDPEAAGPSTLLTSRSFEQVVFAADKDVLVGFVAATAPGSHLFPGPSLELAIDSLVPALARLMLQYQQQAAAQSPAGPQSAAQPTPASSQHGESLVFARFRLGDNQLDPNWRWLPSDLYQRALGPLQNPGCFVLYPAGQKPSEASQQVVCYDSPLSRPAAAQEFERDNAELSTALRWPTLSDLLRFVHRHMQHGTFDLAAVLSMAESSGAQAASEELAQLACEDVLWKRGRLHHSRQLGHTQLERNMLGAVDELPPMIQLHALDLQLLSSTLQPYRTKLRQLQAAVGRTTSDSERLSAASPRAGRDLLQLHRNMLKHLQSPLTRELLLQRSTVDGSEPADGQWSCGDILRVFDRHAALQQQRMMEGGWWPVFDHSSYISVGARLSVFRCSAPLSARSCSSWFMVFQLLRKEASNGAGPTLHILFVTPPTLIRTEAQHWAILGRHSRRQRDLIQLVQDNSRSRVPVCPLSDLQPEVTQALIERPSEATVQGEAETGESESERVSVGQDEAWYSARGVRLANPPQVTLVELSEALLHEHSHWLFASQSELLQLMTRATRPDPAAAVLMQAMQPLLELDDWLHREPTDPLQLPSENPFFQALAGLIADGDRHSFQSKLQGADLAAAQSVASAATDAEHRTAAVARTQLMVGNTHRSHWANAGKAWWCWVDPYRRDPPLL